MLFGIVLMFLILQDSQWTMAVEMCTNHSSSGRDVSLNLIHGTGVSGCTCSVKLSRTDDIGSVKPKMYFEPILFSGCKYKLVISYNNTIIIISCFNNNTVFYEINISDETKLYLEPTNSQDETTIFEVKINSSITGNRGPLIRLDCFLPTVKSTTTSVITTPNILDVPETTSTTVTTQRSTTKSVQPQPTSTTDYIPTAQRTTTPTSIKTLQTVPITEGPTISSKPSTPVKLSSRQVYLTTSSTSSSKQAQRCETMMMVVMMKLLLLGL